MAGNTKYQAAPQRDSFDEPSYSQAPPSYQAEASDPMLGGPRGEDDNIPDDFKVTTHSKTLGMMEMLISYSLAARSLRPLCQSGCSSFARCTQSCKALLMIL